MSTAPTGQRLGSQTVDWAHGREFDDYFAALGFSYRAPTVTPPKQIRTARCRRAAAAARLAHVEAGVGRCLDAAGAPFCVERGRPDEIDVAATDAFERRVRGGRGRRAVCAAFSACKDDSHQNCCCRYDVRSTNATLPKATRELLPEGFDAGATLVESVNRQMALLVEVFGSREAFASPQRARQGRRGVPVRRGHRLPVASMASTTARRTSPSTLVARGGSRLLGPNRSRARRRCAPWWRRGRCRRRARSGRSRST